VVTGWRVLLAVLIGSAALPACGDATCDSCAEATGAASSTGAACADTRGLLAGAVYRYEAPPGPSSSPAPGAIVLLQRTPSDTPLQGMADVEGHYSIELEGGDWIVGGEQQNCSAGMTKSATVTACGTTELELVLDLCTK
jgi:hypothetical protein